MARAFIMMSVFVLVVVMPARSHGDPVTASTLGWTINGIVSEVARAGDVAFVGGSFATVAPSANLVYGVAAFASDSPVPVFPRLQVNGRVRAVVALPGGGWMLGGEFTSINGVAREHLARLAVDGTLDMTFNVVVDDTVWALEASGTTVYLGGDFTTVAGAPHNRLAAINGVTGARVTTFTPSVIGGSVLTIAAGSPNVYFGGDFTTVNGVSRAGVAAVLTASGGSVAAFNAGAPDGTVAHVLLSGADVFVAGDFTTIGGLTRPGVARLSAATGAAASGFNANADGPAYALLLSGSTLYVGGGFGHLGGQERLYLAALSSTSGVATAWNPGATGDVLDLGLTGPYLIAAGAFTEIAGVDRLSLAMLDTGKTSNIATSWNPALGNSADVVVVDGAGTIFAAGDFNNFGAVHRNNLAAIDLLTGDLLPWNPATDGWVHALDVFGRTVYLGGEFSTVGGLVRDHAAAVDAVTGAVSAWNPGPDGPVRGVMAASDAVYFVGSFTALASGELRGSGAATAHNGTVLAWNPSANDDIETVFVDGSRVFLGGAFTMLGVETHNRLGAVNTTTGAPFAGFAPSVNDIVYRVDVQNNLVFFGGGFDLVNGATRNYAAAVRSSAVPSEDGQLVGWHPDIDGPVYDIEAFGAIVYLVGGFNTVGGGTRPGIAAVDATATGGALRPWSPADVSGGAVSVIDASDTAVLFGGLLNDVNGIPIGAVLYPEAVLSGSPRPPTTPDILVRGSSLRVDWGQPPLGARPSAYVMEAGTGPGQSNLASFSTGTPSTTFVAASLPPGTYYLRMRSSNAQGTSAVSREQSFIIGNQGCSGPPTPPLDPAVTVNGSVATFTWRSPPQSVVTGYRLVAGTASYATDIGSFDVGYVTNYSVAAPPGAYFVRVVALNPCGIGAPSGEVVVVVGAVSVPPGAPFALASTVTGSTVALNWSPPALGSGAFQYRVEAGSATGLSNLASVQTSQPAFTATGVPPGVYYVRVRALGAGVGPASNELVVVVP